MDFASKFMGNSSAAILNGKAFVHLLKFEAETYVLTFPTVYARGILWGTLLMELGGEVTVKCERTGLEAIIEFKTKPWVGGDYNRIEGKIMQYEGQGKKMKTSTLYVIRGKWDGVITIKGSKEKSEEVLWDATKAVKRYPMIVRPIHEQDPYESRRVWLKVSNALKRNDQEKATDEKLFLENRQRAEAAEREEKGTEYEPRFFKRDEQTKKWVYKWADVKPYDPEVEGEEMEEAGVIRTFPKGEVPTATTTKSGEQGDGDNVVSSQE